MCNVREVAHIEELTHNYNLTAVLVSFSLLFWFHDLHLYCFLFTYTGIIDGSINKSYTICPSTN